MLDLKAHITLPACVFRPILSDEEYKSEDQSEKSEDSDDQMSSGDDDEELDDKAQSKSKKNRSTTGWLSNNRKGEFSRNIKKSSIFGVFPIVAPPPHTHTHTHTRL